MFIIIDIFVWIKISMYYVLRIMINSILCVLRLIFENEMYLERGEGEFSKLLIVRINEVGSGSGGDGVVSGLFFFMFCFVVIYIFILIKNVFWNK